MSAPTAAPVVGPMAASAPAGHRAPRITYAVSRWGAPTETFVRREAAAVRELGADLRALSMKRPSPSDSDVPVTWLGWGSVMVHAAATMVRAPRVSTRTLRTVVTHSNRHTVGPRLVAALIGLAWAGTPDARADLVHAHFGWVSATAAWAATRVTGRPLSVVLHAFELHSDRCRDRFAIVPLRDAARVFTISDRDRDEVRRRWGVAADVLRMGVSDEWLVPPVPTEDRDRDIVVAVGSLVPKKGHEVLIDAIARTARPWHLDVIGDGPERHALAARITSLGLDGRVRLLGACPEDEVRDRVRRATAVALACVVARNGDRDGIPVALMEAMASATPVVTTRVGAIPELLEGGGLLVEPGDAAALAAALDTLADPDLRDRLGAVGRAKVVAEFRSALAAHSISALALDVDGVER